MLQKTSLSKRKTWLIEMIGAIIQARMLSTRLPGKVLKEINGTPILEMVFERAKKAKKLDKVIIATSTKKADDRIEEFCRKKNIEFFRGSEKNALDRFYRAAKKFGFKTVVRITGDCPLIDPKTIDKAVKLHFESKADYTSNVFERTFPRGLDVEVFSFNALEKAKNLAKKANEKEHVTAFIYNHPEIFKLQSLKAEGTKKRPDIRLCIDTEKDFELIRKIFSEFNHNAEISEIIKWLDKNPEIKNLNIESELLQRKKSAKIGQTIRAPGKKYIAFIADSEKKSGLGHLRRCIALAKEIEKSGTNTVFLIGRKNKNAEKFLKGKKIEFIKCDLGKISKIISELKKPDLKVAIIDSYKLGEEQIKKIKKACFIIVKITDFPIEKTAAEIIVNGNAGAEKLKYPKNRKKLLGTKYFLLNEEFLNAGKKFGKISEKPKVLVCFGGTDSSNSTLKALNALEKIKKISEINAVLGPNYPFWEKISSFAKKSKNLVNLYRNVSNIPEIFEKNEIAVVSASNTAYEAMFLGLPTIAVADFSNQKILAKGFEEKKIALTVTKPSIDAIRDSLEKILSNEKLAKKLSAKSKIEIDGKGPQRVFKEIKKLTG